MLDGIMVSGGSDLVARTDHSLGVAIDFLADTLRVDRCSLLLLSGKPPALAIKTAYGLAESVVKDTRVRLGDGVAGWVALHRKAVLAADERACPELERRNSASYATPSFASVPVMVDGTVAGVLNAADKRDGSAFDVADLQALERGSSLVGELLTFQRLVAAKEETSLSDPLTGLGNRRYLQRRLDQEVARAQRYGQPLSLMLSDVDNFRLINDGDGCQSGNVVLRAIARSIAQTARRSDIVVRYGGDEFAAILPHTGVEAARTAAQRYALAVGELPRPEGVQLPAPPSLSIGISSYPALAADSGQLIDQASAALGLAKAGPAPRILVWQEAGERLSAVQQLGIPQLPAPGEVLTSDVARLIPLDVAYRFHCVPVGFKRGKVAVAMHDPTDDELLRTLARVTRRKIYPVLSSRADLVAALSRMAELCNKQAVASVLVRKTTSRRREVRIALRPLVAGADLGGVRRDVAQACQMCGVNIEQSEPYLLVAKASATGCASLLKALKQVDSLLTESAPSEEGPFLPSTFVQ